MMDDELFREAAEQANKEAFEKMEAAKKEENLPVVPQEELLEVAIHETETNLNAFDRLVHDLENRHAERFNQVLSRLPDKDFARLYPKMLEYARSKKMRDKFEKKGEDNNFINIQIITGSDDEPTTIDITDYGNNEQS